MAGDATIAMITIFCEGSSATPPERRCIAATIINRLRDPRRRFGLTVAEVCLKRFQFSEWNGDRVNNANLLRSARTPDGDLVMADCRAAYADALSQPDPTGGATHYFDHSLDGDPPSWAAPPAELALETAHFRFYRNVP